MQSSRRFLRRPLSISLARCSSASAVAAALAFAAADAIAAPIAWDGGGGDFLWTTPLNWAPDGVPAAGDDLTFGTSPAGTVHLVRDQTAGSLAFTDDYSIGAFGTNLTLTNTSGNITVNPGELATIHASYGGTNGLNLSGGGTLYVTNPLSLYTGNITVSGAGTQLLHRQEGPTVQYNGLGGGQEFGRFDQLTLGSSTAVRNITLTNGGTYKIINTGNNPEGNFKNIIIGTGGGTLNLGAGYIVQNLDDTGQITATTEAFTKAGPGRLIITGTMATTNPLGGVVNVNGGMLSLDNVTSQAVGPNTYNRFTGISATGTTLNINNGGTVMINSGTAAAFDLPTINLNDGGILATNGADHAIGFSVAGGANTVTNLNISGTASFLTRDLFAAQTQRFPRLRAVLNGTGTLNLIPNTNAGGNPRLVIERGEASTFTGTFRLNENESLEANPRHNAVVNTGKVLADGDVEFAGWGGTLDVRDSTATASVFDYTANEITITTTQNGAINVISPGRGDTAAGTANMFNFGTLTMGNHRLAIAGNNSYQTGFADTASIRGDALLLMNADNGFAVFSNPAAIAEDAAGRSLTILKAGVGNTTARDVIVGGTISLSNLQVATGTLQLRGAGAITPGFGGAAPTVIVNGSGIAANGNTLPTQGLLHLDSNTGHAVGANTVIAAANNNDRIADNANVVLRSNSILRLTSANNVGTTETIGIAGGAGGLAVTGHATIDIVKTGTSTTPVALTINNPNPAVTSTVNFTGTGLGTAGANSSRIVIPVLPTGFMGAQFHQGNEWAKYDETVDNGFEIGVTPFVAGDYVINSAENTWAAGQQIKQNGATLPTLTANRSVDRLNFQTSAANQTLNVAGFVLTSTQGGIISSVQPMGFKDGAAGAAPSGTAGITAGTTAAPAGLFVHANNTIEFHLPIVDNAAGGPVTFVKSGTGTVVLSHQGRTVGQAQIAAAPFTTATWSSTNTGGWVINDGMLNVHRGQYLGATPTTVTLNGGQLEINEGVSNANADSILSGWGHNIVVNGNAMIGNDDNGESNDGNTGDRTLVKLGSLTINNGSLLGLAAFSDNDNAFMGGATFAGRPALNIGAGGRSGVNNANIISGVVAGTGFDVVALGGNGATLVIGGTQSDATNNTYNGTLTIYGATVRLNKANGSTALTDGTASEDIIINGGNLFWGPGHHGDLSTTNNVNTTNLGFLGIVPNSPAAIKAAGMNQIADSAAITLLTGTLGESDRITNEKFGTLIMKNGTFNVGLGTVEIDNAVFSGGALGFDRGGTLKLNKASYLPGAFDQSIFTGRPTAGAYTTLEIGAGGISLTGQNITIGNGFSGNVAGAGGRLVLGGDLSFTGSDLIGGSYGRKGIFIQTGSSFRELGNSHIDLAGGVRDFDIDTDAIYTITPPMRNGGLTKSGGGALVLEPYQASTFAGPITVNAGVLQAKGEGAFGTSAGGVTIANGGTVKLDSGWTYGDDFTVTGPGALIPGGGTVREVGALIAESGTNRLTGAVALAGDATLAGNTFLDPSVTPAAGGGAFRIGTLLISGNGGITGSGNLTLSGPGDGVIVNGVNTTAGTVTKDGAGRWTVAGPSTYVGTTLVTAGELVIANNAALGSANAGTSVVGGALELTGGLSVAEPLTLRGAGSSVQSGAIVSLGGNNTISGSTSLGGDATIRSESGLFTLGNVGASGTPNPELTLSGAGDGAITGGITTGAAAALTKAGEGVWTLSGPNTFGGATNVDGGVLALNYANNNTAKIASAAPLNMGGGALVITGNGAAATTQAVSGLNLIAGAGDITVNSTGAQSATLALGAITRSAGSTADFDRPSTGAITTSTGNTNGILGGYATVNNTSDWAAVTGGNIVAFTGYTPLSAATTPAQNAVVNTGQAQSGILTANSLKIDNAAGLSLGTDNLTLTSGGVLYSGNSVSGISGTGLVSGNGSGDELIIHTSGGILDVNTSLVGPGAGSLTKAGAGTLVVRGASSFEGSVNINEGTLLIPGAPAFPGTLGASVVGGNRLININGGSFGILADWDINDWDAATAGIQSLQFNIGPAGGTLKTLFGSNLIINDGSATPGVATQLMGSGDLTLTGGGRYSLSGGAPQFLGYTGNVTVESGILTLGHSNSIGGRQGQTITLKSGSAIINSTNFGLGQNGLPNNIVAEDGVEFYGVGGSRVFGGDVQLSGTSTIALMERDNGASERQLFFNGRVSGTGVTLNAFGIVNSTPFYLASGSNPLTGTINLNANAVLETRMPGSVGLNAGDVTINLQGANSRLLLRHFQNGDFRANVNVTATSEINSDRLVNYGGGANQILSINNLNVNAGVDRILTFGGGNTYMTAIGGTTTFSSDTVINAVTNVLFDSGINFTGGATELEKRSGGSIVLRGPSNNSGPTTIQGGFLILQGGGTLPNTSRIDLRGGELRVDNSDVINTNRLNDAAPITLGGGVLRITGDETLGTVTAVTGTTQVVSNPINETVPNPLTLTGFTRALGAVVQFQSPDVGGAALAVGQNTVNQTRVGSRILIPGQADSGNQTIPGFVGNNSLDFIQYDGTTIDSGAPLGVRDMRNPGNAQSPANYTDNAAETAWTDSVILRRTNPTDNTIVTDTLTANRALDAMKVETGGTNRDYTIALGANNLRIEGGGILVVGNTTANFLVTGTTGVLTAGSAVPGAATAELIIGGNGTAANGVVDINAIIGDNGTQSVALVKTGASVLNLGGAAANTYTGGTFVTSGTLNTTVNGAFGAAANPITLSGGTLQFNIADAGTDVNLGGLGQNVTVTANSAIILDNGAMATLDNNLALGNLTINGGATLAIRGFDSVDLGFTGTHTFSGTPTIDLNQAGSGSNPNTAATATVVTLSGPITGSGFYVTSSGNTNDTAARLQIGGGATDTAANTYTGKVTTLQGSNTEDNFIELNKAAGTNAITGDLELNGSNVVLNADDQIVNTSNVVNNRAILNFNGKSETIASLVMNGGYIVTNDITAGSTPAANVVTVTGPVTVTGRDDMGGLVPGNGLTIGNNSTLNVGGLLTIGTFGRVHLAEGATAAVLNVNGGLQMTGALLHQNNGAGPNIVRLSSDVTTLASPSTSNIGNSSDSDTFLELNGARTFTVADGGAGIDLSLSTVIRDSTSPAVAGSLIKNGPGLVQIQGGGTGNSYSGATVVNEGGLVLFKNGGVDSLGSGAATNTLTIGDGVGGAKADKVIDRNSDQIDNGTDVTVASSGVLDLQTYNTNETIGAISGSGAVDLGPGSTFTTNSSTSTIFSGAITGAGKLVKDGSGTLELSGVNDVAGGTTINGTGTLQVSNKLGGSVLANLGSILSGSGTITGPVTIEGTLSPGPNTAQLDTGSLTIDSGSTLTIDIRGNTAGTGYDQVNTTGSVTLLGGSIDLTLSGYAPQFADRFYVILNDGTDPVAGSFAGLPEGAFVGSSGPYAFFIGYSGNGDGGSVGNDVFLSIPEPASFATLVSGMAMLCGLQRFRRRRG
jgi:autotransporter-associated beta strand protein